MRRGRAGAAAGGHSARWYGQGAVGPQLPNAKPGPMPPPQSPHPKALTPKTLRASRVVCVRTPFPSAPSATLAISIETSRALAFMGRHGASWGLHGITHGDRGRPCQRGGAHSLGGDVNLIGATTTAAGPPPEAPRAIVVISAGLPGPNTVINQRRACSNRYPRLAWMNKEQIPLCRQVMGERRRRE